MSVAKILPRFGARQLVLTVALLAALAALVVLPSYGSAYIVILVISILMYVILTVSWVLFSGSTGYISLAPAAFFGIGIYTAAVFGKQVPFALLIALAALISFAFAILIGAITLRLRGIYFTIFTFGLVLLIDKFLTWWEVNFTGTRGRFVVVIDNETIYYHILGIFVALLLTSYFIGRSKYGLALRSIGQDEEAAAHAGINVTLVKVTTFGISALFMGAVGSAMATRWTYIDPSIAFSVNYSFFPVLMAIFGGMGTLYGPVLGAIVFAYLEEILLTRFPYYYMLIFGLVMVSAVTFLPDGLIGLLQKWRRGGAVKSNANT